MRKTPNTVIRREQGRAGEGEVGKEEGRDEGRDVGRRVVVSKEGRERKGWVEEGREVGRG